MWSVTNFFVSIRWCALMCVCVCVFMQKVWKHFQKLKIFLWIFSLLKIRSALTGINTVLQFPLFPTIQIYLTKKDNYIKNEKKKKINKTLTMVIQSHTNTMWPLHVFKTIFIICIMSFAFDYFVASFSLFNLKCCFCWLLLLLLLLRILFYLLHLIQRISSSFLKKIY